MIIQNKLARLDFERKYNFAAATPMMKQYLDIKFTHQDCFLLFRMGDFFELFFEDAIIASKILGIALAKRGKTDNEEIPMCGVPHHASENYIYKLLESGVKIAIADQMETPEVAKQRDGHKAVVKREVTRIITPGTVIEDIALDSRKPNYLASIKSSKNFLSVCYADITTGFIKLLDIKEHEIASVLAKIDPKEIIISQQDYEKEIFKKSLINYDLKLIFQVEQIFERKKCIHSIEDYYKINSYLALGDLNDSQIATIGSILQYIVSTYKTNQPKLEYPIFESTDMSMRIDHTTIRALELIESSQGKKNKSLLSVIDKTLTSSGSRALYNILLSPLISKDLISQRQEYVDFFVQNPKMLKEIREILLNSSDFERSFNKILMRRCLPYDMLVVKDSLSRAYLIKEKLYNEHGLIDLEKFIKAIHAGLAFDNSILDLISEAILDDPSNSLTDGGYINPQFHGKLLEITNLKDNNKIFIEKLKNKYQQLTSLDSLRISSNNILGLYVEVSAKNAEKMNNPIFIFKQSTSTANRYTTIELQELQLEIVNANSLAVSLEREIFENLCIEIEKKRKEIKRVIETLSQIDVFSSLAFLALENNYTRPEITEDKVFIIEDGRHPIVETYLKLNQEKFTENDTKLTSDSHIILLTGPNMGGKSTYLRQNAVIAIMAQIGSYVPAKYCKLGIVDRIFSRVGSADDLSGGKSTFMVEMIETSAILAQASERSLVIFDEVGRGTSTYDGMSIAWAILEYIHNIVGCRTFFATHYHELTNLAKNLKALKNFSVHVESDGGKIYFTHKVIEGAADKSYGIHVAELAGIPKHIIKRSKSLLKELEQRYNKDKIQGLSNIIYQEDMFKFKEAEDIYQKKYLKLSDKLHQVNLDEITPKQAHDILVELQKYDKIIPREC